MLITEREGLKSGGAVELVLVSNVLMGLLAMVC
jgi:hypothetical protein